MICECGHDESEHESLGCMHEFPNTSFCKCINNPCSFSIKTEAQLIAELRQRVAELEAAQAIVTPNGETLSKRIDAFLDANLPQIVTPNNCRHCQRAAEQMREAAADAAIMSNETRANLSAQIRALPLPECDGKALKPE
ncbi:MAG: hypothetical protein IPO08_22465 [Xanthomonadales bacterium]|nr:hypothetical protein [Xanthomonadales bacterium]